MSEAKDWERWNFQAEALVKKGNINEGENDDDQNWLTHDNVKLQIKDPDPDILLWSI